MKVIAWKLQDQICASGDTFILRKSDFDSIMFLEITSSVRRMREMWALLRMIPGFTAVNQSAYSVEVFEFADWLKVDFKKPLISQIV